MKVQGDARCTGMYMVWVYRSYRSGFMTGVSSILDQRADGKYMKDFVPF